MPQPKWQKESNPQRKNQIQEQRNEGIIQHKTYINENDIKAIKIANKI